MAYLIGIVGWTAVLLYGYMRHGNISWVTRVVALIRPKIALARGLLSNAIGR